MSPTGTKTPRVGFLVDTYPTLQETFVYRQVRALASAVACATRNEDLIDAARDCPIESVTGGEPFEGSGRAALFRRAWARVAGHASPLWNQRTEDTFRRWLEAHRIEVVLAQFGANGVRARAACEALDVPLVVQFFGQDASSMLLRPRYARELPAMFDLARGVVVVARDMGDRLIPLGCDASKIHPVAPGVPTDLLQPSRGVGEQPCRFLAAHRFVPKKGTLESLEAFRRCRRQVPDAEFDLVGDGHLEGRIHSFVRQHGLEGAVRIHESVENDVLRERFLRNAGCFVQHSRTAPNGDREGWPVVIGEAAASGLPVVATRHAAIPEQVLDGRTGHLVEEGDVEGMARAMIALAADPEAREAMGAAARAHMRAVGDLDTQIEALRTLLVRATA